MSKPQENPVTLDDALLQLAHHTPSGVSSRISGFEGSGMDTDTLSKLEGIIKAHGLTLYHQGDPRGAALYVLRPSDLADGVDVDSCYSRGIAVY